jgi:predicted TIM-barrel fold metal-dependent hydrolase
MSDDVYLKQRDRTRAPSFAVPPNACDCHAHIFGDPARFPFIAERNYTPTPALEPQYLEMLATLGVTRAVIVQPSVYGLDNRCTLAAVAKIGLPRARAVAMFDATATDAELRALDAAGVRGVRFITISRGGAPLDQLQAVADRIAPLGWHIQMYVTPETWRDLYPVIVKLPVPMVIDHMGQVTPDRTSDDPGYSAILRLLDSGRAWIKLTAYRVSNAGPPYHDVKPVAQNYLRHAPERCVWGSDWPHPDLSGYMPDDGELMDLLVDWAPDAELRKRVLVDNPAALYGFDTR